LIIGLSNIGDAILMSGVVAAVRAHEPDAHLTLVVGERARAVFVDDPRVQVLVDADRYGSMLGRLKLMAALWRYRPHTVIDLRHTIYPMLLNPLAAWRYLRRPPRGIRHMRDRHRWMLSAQAPGIAPSAASVAALSLTTRDEAYVDTLWARWKLDGRRAVVVVCPGARSHIKRWTAEGFARLSDRLIAERGAEVVLSGEPDEKPIVDEILGVMRERAHAAVGLLTVRQLGALMRRAQLVITNDSASLHLASAVETPTLAVFGPTDERKYGPTAPRSRIVRRRLFCAPCEEAACRYNHECMRFISADEVYEEAVRILQEGQGAGGRGRRGV
jgi:ADP-heptose:LPS heptosyltransferase